MAERLVGAFLGDFLAGAISEDFLIGDFLTVVETFMDTDAFLDVTEPFLNDTDARLVDTELFREVTDDFLESTEDFLLFMDDFLGCTLMLASCVVFDAFLAEDLLNGVILEAVCFGDCFSLTVASSFGAGTLDFGLIVEDLRRGGALGNFEAGFTGLTVRLRVDLAGIMKRSKMKQYQNRNCAGDNLAARAVL